MIFRVVLLLFAASIFTGCPMSGKKPDKAKGKAEQMKDQNGDASFQAFLGRLRKAVELHDSAMLAGMMAPDFGYRWDRGPETETPFSFWDRNKLWGELSAAVRNHWTPHEAFMVSPPQFAQNPNYPGYRAGLTQINGSWRFAYFVPAPPPLEDAPASAAPEAPSGEKPLPPLPQ
jgi:hypothetical protein